MRAAQLEVLAAEVSLIRGPSIHISMLSMAMELDAVLAVTIAAAPVLLLCRPSLNPVGGACVAIVAAFAHSMHMLHMNDGMSVPVSMPRARAAHLLVGAAPVFLWT